VLGRLADLAATAGWNQPPHDIRQGAHFQAGPGTLLSRGAGRVQSRQVDLINALLGLTDPWATGASPAQPATEPLLACGDHAHHGCAGADSSWRASRCRGLCLRTAGARPSTRASLEDWLTVAGAQAMNESLSHVEIEHPARFPARVDHSGRHAGREKTTFFQTGKGPKTAAGETST